MGKKIKSDFPSAVPCKFCGSLVQKSVVVENRNYSKGKLTVENVPQYECECGTSFLPVEIESELEKIVHFLSKDGYKGNISLDFNQWSQRGRRAFPRK